jgi:hypothetical protein
MSVDFQIDNPVNDKEQYWLYPIATQAAFNQYWVPAAEELGLTMIQQFIAPQLFVTKDDVPALQAEFEAVAAWARENIDNPDHREYIVERAERSARLLPVFFTRDDLVLVIG